MTELMLCACGCGRAIANPKPKQRFWSDACRKRVWARNNAILVCVHCGRVNHLTNRPQGLASPEVPSERQRNGIRA